MFVAVAALPVPWVSAVAPTAGYQEVQRAFIREDFEEVTELAQAFILENPGAPEVPRVWVWLALSFDRLARPHEALRELQRVRRRLHSRDPLWAEALFWEGDVGRRAFQMVRAKIAYERLLDRHPESKWTSQAQLGLGLIALHQQKFESAIEQFRRISSQDVPSEGKGAVVLDALLFEGMCRFHLKQFTEAVALLSPLLERLDEVAIPQTAFYLGESLSALERYEEAVQAYQRAVDVGETGQQWTLPARFGMGWAYYRIDQCEESISEFTRYLAEATVYRTEARFAQGSCLIKGGQVKQALLRFEQIVSRDPEHALALESAFVLVDAYRREERFSLAKALLHSFLRQDVDAASQSQIQIRLGTLALDQGNHARARTIFVLAAEQDEPDVRQAALSGLGDVALSVGELTDAQAFYEEAVTVLAQTSLTDYAAYQLGRIHLQLGEFDLAIGTFRRLAAQGDALLADDATLALVIAHVNLKEVDAAQALLEGIRRERAGSELAARAGYYEALLALREGDENAARAHCEALIARAPLTDEAFEARLLLAELQSRETSPREVMDQLLHVYNTERLPKTQRAKLAQRLGDFARRDGVYPEAIKWYERAGRLLPSLQSEAFYRIASCYEESGDIELAIAWYKKVTKSPWRVRGQLAIAKLLERQNRFAGARKIYEQLAEEPIPEAKLMKERLAALRSDGMNEE